MLCRCRKSRHCRVEAKQTNAWGGLESAPKTPPLTQTASWAKLSIGTAMKGPFAQPQEGHDGETLPLRTQK
jgi:hypothetical protein